MIRAATSGDLSAHWLNIGWDIEEPLLVADYGTHRLVFDFSEGHVLMVDELPPPASAPAPPAAVNAKTASRRVNVFAILWLYQTPRPRGIVLPPPLKEAAVLIGPWADFSLRRRLSVRPQRHEHVNIPGDDRPVRRLDPTLPIGGAVDK